MMHCYREPTLEELLSDPIVRTVMQSDAVDPLELDDLLTEVARKLNATARDKSEPSNVATARSPRPTESHTP